jgi:hypothetical protein
VPIEVSLDRVTDSYHPEAGLKNVSIGGLSFHSPGALPVGQMVNINFPQLDAETFLSAQVVWNRKLEDGVEIGVSFADAEQIFQLRMIEQICHIEHYRKEMREHHQRELSSEQAAKEWIERYAAEFPGNQ